MFDYAQKKHFERFGEVLVVFFIKDYVDIFSSKQLFIVCTSYKVLSDCNKVITRSQLSRKRVPPMHNMNMKKENYNIITVGIAVLFVHLWMNNMSSGEQQNLRSTRTLYVYFKTSFKKPIIMNKRNKSIVFVKFLRYLTENRLVTCY